MTPSLQRLLLLAALLGGATLASAQPAPAPAPKPTEAETKSADDTEATDGDGTIKAIRLEAVEITGSRIRRLEVEGPSPVSTYDREYIRSTGALTLADFMNYLPQNYTGIGAGRGSAPNELNPEFGQRTETTTPAFNFVLGSSAASPGQTGVSGASLRGLGSGSTLVLVDGRRAAQSGAGNRSTDSRQGFVDLNTIPLGMVDRIEVVTDGASAIYGADAVAGVINVILKKDWTGHELSGTFKGSEHGGGRERSLTLTSGFADGKLRGTVSLSYYDRAPLKASQRSFSKNQDHRSIVAGTNPDGTPIYGRDLRLNWGYPAVVQAQPAVPGDFVALPGIRVVLVPEGATSTPSVSGFIPVTTPVPPNTAVFPTGQRRANTAEFLDIIPASERQGIAGNFTYEISPTLDLYGKFGYNETFGFYNSQPAVSSASAITGFGNFSTLVPAALNPFNQNVIVGMVHYEFGSIWQKTTTRAYDGLIGLRGQVGETWFWDSGFGVQRNRVGQITRSFNGAAISAALSSGRLNPFIDARATGPIHAAVYETMALYPYRNAASELVTWDFQASGHLFEFWGGPVQLAFGGVYNRAENSEVAVNYSTAVTPVVTGSAAEGVRHSRAIFTELSVPFVGKPNAMPGVRRLELQLAGRYEDYSRAGDTTVPKVGFTWVPVESVLLRGSFSEGFRAPALTEYQVANTISTNNTVQDPRRTPPSTTGVTLTRGSNTNIKPETSQNEFYGIIIEPPVAKGLSFGVDYYRTTQENVIQTLSAQTIINNENLFASRITRAAPDATDTSLNQPGRITAVDLSFVNFGKVQNESLDFLVNYDLPWQDLGRWRLVVSATKTLKSTRELAPGLPPVVDEDDTFAPPEWRYNASVFWSKGSWNASLFYTYIDGFATNRAGNSLTFTYPVPSAWKLDVRGGYEFKNGVWRGYGKGLRIVGGIGNVFDEEPPFSDTIFGYNGGLHGSFALGRSYELSFVLPF